MTSIATKSPFSQLQAKPLDDVRPRACRRSDQIKRLACLAVGPSYELGGEQSLHFHHVPNYLVWQAQDGEGNPPTCLFMHCCFYTACHMPQKDSIEWQEVSNQVLLVAGGTTRSSKLYGVLVDHSSLPV